jgi:DNA recombination protein RmuC
MPADIIVITSLFTFLGAALGWLWASFRARAHMLPKTEVAQKYVARELYNHLQEQSDMHREDLLEKEEELRVLAARLAAFESVIVNLEDKLAHQRGEMQAMQERARLEFEQLAARLLEEKGNKFTVLHQEKLHDLLAPLREKIQAFEAGIEKRFIEETRDRAFLQKEIEQLRALNERLSLDANNLASALKGDSKTQGDWGELRLEVLLEKAGLERGLHFEAQSSFRDEDGAQKRPDYIIHLPEDRRLIIDCKVSLSAYERYCSTEDEKEKSRLLKAHLDSLRQHVRELAGKNYQQLYQINSPDYLLLFVPVEPALTLATQHDQRLFTDALERDIVLVGASTLLATLRTVSFIWKQEKQKRNVLEIARQSGLLYDRFCAFVDDLRAIGQRLDQAQNAYSDALNKLSDGRRYGDTLVGRAERLRELGARNAKTLPPDLLDDG